MLLGAAAWTGRSLSVLLGLLCILVPEHGAERPLSWCGIGLGAFFIGVAALSWPRTERIGAVLALGGLWAALTGFALIAFLDPQAVIADSRLGSGRREIGSETGAYVWGTIMLLLGNAPLVFWLLLRRVDRRPDPTATLLTELGHRGGRARDRRPTRSRRRRRGGRRP
ncbi:hypothetical protein [Nocardioides sp.]|uniref:hypothetical protein n=1 Tax=Nocardioides sp. TaxID=35761 RepID=UPI003517C06A